MFKKDIYNLHGLNKGSSEVIIGNATKEDVKFLETISRGDLINIVATEDVLINYNELVTSHYSYTKNFKIEDKNVLFSIDNNFKLYYSVYNQDFSQKLVDNVQLLGGDQISMNLSDTDIQYSHKYNAYGNLLHFFAVVSRNNAGTANVLYSVVFNSNFSINNNSTSYGFPEFGRRIKILRNKNLTENDTPTFYICYVEDATNVLYKSFQPFSSGVVGPTDTGITGEAFANELQFFDLEDLSVVIALKGITGDVKYRNFDFNGQTLTSKDVVKTFANTNIPFAFNSRNDVLKFGDSFVLTTFDNNDYNVNKITFSAGVITAITKYATTLYKYKKGNECLMKKDSGFVVLTNEAFGDATLKITELDISLALIKAYSFEEAGFDSNLLALRDNKFMGYSNILKEFKSLKSIEKNGGIAFPQGYSTTDGVLNDIKKVYLFNL